MKCGWKVPLLAGVVTFLGLGLVAYQQSRTFQLRSCGISAGAQCQEGGCKCTRWLIEWRGPAGTVTGVTVAPTLDAAEKARDRDLAIDRDWAKMLGTPVTEQPGPPICDLCLASTSTPSPTAASQLAARLYDEWTRKSGEELVTFVSALFGPSATLLNNPGQAFMRGLVDHAKAWRQAIAAAKHLRREMLLTDQQANRLSTSLDTATRALQADMGAIESTFRALPPNIQEAIRGHGGGQQNLEQLKAWVRTNFLRVVGRPISDTTATDDAQKLLAYQERGQLQKMKDFFVNEEWPSLRGR